jgi:ribosomal protein S18 acetylase RimI-like enzyme
VSDPRLDELAEAARNRGLKLVRSRVRTPSKRRFGKVGLTDKAGKPVFGMDAKGPTGKAEEVEEYLLKLGAMDWSASLDSPAPQPMRRRKTPARAAANDRSVGPVARQPRQAAPPKPEIREARPSDAATIAELITYLGHPIDEKQVRKNMAALRKTGETPLVATIDKKVVGLCGVGQRTVISRPAPLGRITSLVVARDAQGRGIGRLLVEAAEERMRKAGCKLVEVTSNDRRTAAHAFYRHLGYERTSIRFAKDLA